MSAELKPCPFCGGRPWDRGFRRWECGTCGAQGPSGPRTEATDAWNRRAPAPSTDSGEAGLREGVVKLLDELIRHVVAIGPEIPRLRGTDREYEIPMARRVWREVFTDLIVELATHQAGEKVSAPSQGGSTDRTARLEKALELALAWLVKQEPGDSRAVSDEYVAMLAVLCNVQPNEPGQEMSIIEAALRREEESPNTTGKAPEAAGEES